MEVALCIDAIIKFPAAELLALRDRRTPFRGHENIFKISIWCLKNHFYAKYSTDSNVPPVIFENCTLGFWLSLFSVIGNGQLAFLRRQKHRSYQPLDEILRIPTLRTHVCITLSLNYTCGYVWYLCFTPVPVDGIGSCDTYTYIRYGWIRATIKVPS